MSFEDELHHINREHEKNNEEFARLDADPMMRPVSLGDRVVVAAGLIGRGHRWVRKEAKVVEVGDTSVRVRFSEARWNGEPDEEWLHPSLVIDILPSAPLE